ncbi:Putative F-box protein At1g32420 [Linum grandiflorum]
MELSGKTGRGTFYIWRPCPLKGCPCKLEEEEEDEGMVDRVEPKKEEESGDFNLKPHVRTKRNDLDDDMVVTQILSRLPAKSLVRFKSVRKGWQSIMEQDSHFINLHRTHSQARPPRLLTIVPKRKMNEENSTCFDLLSADLHCDVRGATIRSSIMTVQMPRPDVEVLGPVRGLLCFTDLANCCVLIYNVSTRQAVTPWIRSSVSQKKLLLDELVCDFGFDPDTGEHKVIFVWHQSKSWIPAACEILTVGVDASWRIVDAVMPPFSLVLLESISANGSIYWMERETEQDGSYSDYLVAFDIGSEKFRTIKVPIFTFSSFRRYGLIELDGCVTIMLKDCPQRDILTLWKFHDRNKNGKSDSESEDWTAVTIKFPFNIQTVLFHSLPGKDEIILETCGWFPGDFESTCFYSYNRVNKTFSKFKIRGIPSLPEHHGCRSKFFVEDLFPAAEKKPVKNLS